MPSKTRNSPSSNRNRPSVSIIGAGRLGSALAVALENADYQIDAVIARRLAKARQTSKLLDGETLPLDENQLSRLPASDINIISTPDDQIPVVAKRLADLGFTKGKRQVFLHTSGALSSAVLSPLSATGASVGSLHPLIAVTEPKTGARALRQAFWCIEGDRAAVKAARRIVKNLDGHSFSIEPDKKPLYHAAAVMVSGHMVALFDIAIGMLVKSGLSRKIAREILLPLIQSNARNLAGVDTARALTGSFARGDLATVERHLRAMADNGLKEETALYSILGSRSVELAKRVGTDRKALKRIKKLLQESQTHTK
ncbi:MAG TPA: Rossmann-like and DUF2520 domain-containing protein [Pyrinomonadaceae bacterium]|nr:Rossmann-like and DUF2520 domain-containing protein [Pyrinomonadaceae bacterium]